MGEFNQFQKIIIRDIIRLDNTIKTVTLCLAFLAVTDILGLIILFFGIVSGTFVLFLWAISLFLDFIFIILIGVLSTSGKISSRLEVLMGEKKIFKEYIKRGENYAAMKDFDQAKKYLKIGLEEAQREKNEEWIKRATTAFEQIEEYK
ncbi:MAG: hypothetical protein ACTSRE_09930 [Promethearchaeota archaeon]